MDVAQELADYIANRADLGVEVLRAAGAIWNAPVRLNWNRDDMLRTISALTALLSLALNYIENLTYLDERIRAFRTCWDNSNAIQRIIMLNALFNHLAQTSFPGLVTQGWTYLMQGHLQVWFRRLWHGSSLEVRSGFGFAILWVAIFQICLPSYRWLGQRP